MDLLFLPPHAEHDSAFLWLWVTHNVFCHKKAAREARVFTFLSHMRAWRDTLPPDSHLVGEGRQTSHPAQLPELPLIHSHKPEATFHLSISSHRVLRGKKEIHPSLIENQLFTRHFANTVSLSNSPHSLVEAATEFLVYRSGKSRPFPK